MARNAWDLGSQLGCEELEIAIDVLSLLSQVHLSRRYAKPVIM